MKKIYNSLLITLFLVPAISCQKEAEQDSANGGIVPVGMKLITLSAASEQTKTTLSEGHTLWAAGDQIAVICSDGSVSSPFDIVDGAGTANAQFSGYIPDATEPVYAVSPAASFSSMSGSTVKVSIPTSREGDFGSGNIAVAKVSENALPFKNVTAFISFTLPGGTDVTSVMVESVDGSNLAGVLSIDCSGAVPAPTATIESGSSSITTTTSSGAGTYYIAIAPGVTHAKGFKMSYKVGDDVTGVYYLNRNITTAVNTIYQMGEVETNGNYFVTVSGAGNGNGMSWANAMSAAQMWKKLHLKGEDTDIDGVKFASINGAKFLLAAGSYDWGAASIGNTADPTININETDEVSFTIEGGYNASTGARDIANNVTSFSGNSEHRILSLGGKMNVTFDGISFVDGYVDGDGGAVNVSGGTWSFNACTFSGNTATNGGAMELGGSSDVNISDCLFSNNTVTGSGGAIDSDMAATSITGGSFSNNTAARGGAISFFNAGKRTIQGTSFSGNSSTAEGGAIYARYNIEAKECTFSGNQSVNGGAIFVYQAFRAQVYGCTFQENAASQNGGAISVDYNAKLTVADYHDTYSQFIGNTAKNDGGALYIYTSKPYGSTNDNNIINHSVFKGNNAIYNGGSIAVTSTASTTKVYISQCTFGGNGDGESNVANFGGAVYAEKDTFVNIGNSSFTGNRARNNGGAFCIEGDSYLNLFRDTFVGNYGQSGGAGYACNLDSKYPRLFIDECSFDANYISTHYGCLFNLNGIDDFCMHNSSVRGSYISASQTGEKASWIDLDGVQGNISISNSSIIGAASNSSLVWACNGSIYLTNSIIVQDNSGQKSIHGDSGATLDVNYTIYSAATTIATSDNNTSGKASGDIDGLSWSQDDSSYEGSAYYWKWDGTIGGATPSMTTQSDVNTRVSGICQDFVDWSDSDFGKDQRNATRSSTWWPGAYQPDI